MAGDGPGTGRARRIDDPGGDHRRRHVDLVERDRRHLWHPYAPMPSPLPAVPVVSAAGTTLTLADGRQVIDGMSSWWAAIHGHRHPVLDEAVRTQLESMAHVMFGGITHPAAVELAELLVEIAPCGLEHVFFADSGSVSVEVAVKMALQYARGTGHPERTRLLTVASGYHGDTLAAMSVCDPVTGMHSMFNDVLPVQLFAPAPQPRYGETFRAEHIADFAGLMAAHREEIAAVILEPVVQGAGGMRFYSPDYLAEVRRLCDEHHVLLIADEIATGFGRSGRLFGCDHAGISPDIMCVGKALTGGYLSMAATLCTAEVAAGVSAAESGALMHGPTFMGNPLAAATATASIRLLLSRPWESEVAAIEASLRAGLAPADALAGVAEVRVLGAIGVIETTDPVPVAASQELLLDRGVWLRPFGRLLYTMPPYISGEEELRRITSAMVAAAEALP
ncbi:MAG: adenosylmethionine--8-amino-7-oxononanoate transaminase [Acidimicrobiia bacterium]|nr:adenosylmethionine--8-amino-7-oxononanoate transaminase [Acidimicrobiia bacterium]MYC45314.1 adenosylmethionine--8-amino-7-oxononanoate transaminase [Acidimicrobiia bacterium]